MAICNLFKKLEKTTGTFLTFSQYTEDLTKMYTQPGQLRVTPSKFIALDIDYQKWWDNAMKKNNEAYDGANSEIPTILQNYFENGCAAVKDYLAKKIKDTESNEVLAEGWNPEYAKNIFWNTMVNYKFINDIDENNNTDNIINEIVYIGDINMQNYNNYANIGYNEIYCHIPSEGKRIQFKMEYPKIDVTSHEAINHEGVLIGHKEPIEGALPMEVFTTYYYDIAYDALNKLSDEYITDVDDKSFKFNTIVLLYDLMSNNYDGSEATIEYANIPMGIYFSGIVDETGNMTNSTIKYVSNEDAYGAGTSYGIRICNRFMTNPESDYHMDWTYDEEDYQINSTELLSEMAETMTKLNDLIDKQHTDLKLVKDMLTEVRANRVNVPYIKEINGYNHWFVNGKYLGVKEPCVSYTNDEINKQINIWESNEELPL